MLLGALITGAGFVLTSRADSLRSFYLTYILTGIGTAATWSPPLAVVQRWFDKKRGLALGIVASGVGIGTMLLSPLLSWFISSYGWRDAYIGLGVLCCVALTLSALVLKQSPLPQEKGVLPYGAAPQRMTSSIHTPANHQGETPAAKEHRTIAAAVRTKAFRYILSIYTLSLVPIYVIPAHIVRFATDRGVTALVAASALGAFGIGGTSARLCFNNDTRCGGNLRRYARPGRVCRGPCTADSRSVGALFRHELSSQDDRCHTRVGCTPRSG